MFKFFCHFHIFYHFKRQKFVNLMFMRKYVHLAKGIKPQLTKEAADVIAEEYTKLRNQENLENDHMARVGYILVISKEKIFFFK